MAEGRIIAHTEEAIVLRTWPFHEADLLISLFTREGGKVKGVARHAMRSRKRFGGALEPATHVRAHYTERPKQDLVRMDSFEILWSPLSLPVDLQRVAGMQLVVEVLEEVMPEGAPEDNVFRLARAVLGAMEAGAEPPAGVSHSTSRSEVQPDRGSGSLVGSGVWLPVTYFCLWMNRLMGWWPELGHCSVCGLDLRGHTVWWSLQSDGVTCEDDRRSASQAVSAEAIRASYAAARLGLPQWTDHGAESGDRDVLISAELGPFAIGVLERHMERRLRSAACLSR